MIYPNAHAKMDAHKFVRCKRCRNVHRANDRPDILDTRYKFIKAYNNVCPRCECSVYQDEPNTFISFDKKGWACIEVAPDGQILNVEAEEFKLGALTECRIVVPIQVGWCIDTVRFESPYPVTKITRGGKEMRRATFAVSLHPEEQQSHEVA